MKIKCLFLFLVSFSALSQNVTFEKGPVITRESVSNLEYQAWFKDKYSSNPNDFITNQIVFLGKLENKYYVLKKTGDYNKRTLLVFNDKLLIENAFPMHPLPNVEKSSLLTQIVFQERMYFFYDAPMDAGNRFLYAWCYDPEQHKFLNPVVLNEVPKSSPLDHLDCNVSENGNYLGMAIDPFVKSTSYTYHYKVFDAQFESINSGGVVESTFPKEHDYRNCLVSNSGDFYMIFDKDGQQREKFGREENAVDPQPYYTYIVHKKEGERDEKLVEFPERVFMNITPFNREGKVLFYTSWILFDTPYKTGFSIYDPETQQELFRDDFDPEWVLPFIRFSGSGVEDYNQKKGKGNVSGNVYYQWISEFEQDEFHFYLMKKATLSLISTSTPGTGVDGSPYFRMDGDILVIRENLESGEVTRSKIVRRSRLFSSDGEVVFVKDGQIHFVYYSILKEEGDKVPEGMAALSKYSAVYLTSIDMESLEDRTVKVISYAKKESFEYFLRLFSFYRDETEFVMFGHSMEDERLIRAKYQQE